MRNIKKFFRNNPRLPQVIAVVLILVGLTYLFTDYFKRTELSDKIASCFQAHRNDNKLLIQSELPLPTSSVLLPRSDLLLQIERSFNNQQSYALKIVAIIGIGGSGKTTLARQYARSQPLHVVWEINAETKNSLITSFENLALALCNTDEEKKVIRNISTLKNSTECEGNLLKWVKERLSLKQDWLLIYDNVEKFSDIQRYFPTDPSVWGKGKIIITTRDSNVKNDYNIHHTIYMSELEPREKLWLFANIMSDDHGRSLSAPKEKEILSFVNELPSFPLDLSTAGYYIKATSISYKDYLRCLKECNKQFLDEQENIVRKTSNYKITRYGIIALSLKNMINIDRDFIELLILISLINSQNIPIDLLMFNKNEYLVDNFIFHLNKYSLILKDPNQIARPSSFISLHRSKQAIIWLYLLKTLSLEKNYHLLRNVSDSFVNYTSKIIEQQDLTKMKQLISHYRPFLDNKSLKNFERGLLGIQLARIYYYLGDYAQAKQLLEVGIFNLNENQKDIRYAQGIAYLGIVLRELGEYPEAKKLLEQSLKIYDKEFSLNHIGAAWALLHLSNIYREFGDYDKAISVLRHSIATYRQYYGNNHPKLSWAMEYLGDVYRSMGRYDDAISCYEESVSIHNRNAHISNIRSARVSALLAICHKNSGNLRKARALLETNLQIYKRELSETSVETAWAMIQLGDIYNVLGCYSKAKTFLQDGLTIIKEYYGTNHIKTSWGTVYLSDVYINTHMFSKAKEMLEHSLQVHENHFGKNHYKIGWVNYYLGKVHKHFGDYVKAKHAFEKCYQVYKQHYGENHLDTLLASMHLGMIYLQEGRIEIAEKMLNHALKVLTNTNHPESYLCLEYLAELCLKKADDAQNQSDKDAYRTFQTQAISNLKKSLEIAKTHFPEDSQHIKRIQSRLASQTH